MTGLIMAVKCIYFFKLRFRWKRQTDKVLLDFSFFSEQFLFPTMNNLNLTASMSRNRDSPPAKQWAFYLYKEQICFRRHNSQLKTSEYAVNKCRVQIAHVIFRWLYRRRSQTILGGCHSKLTCGWVRFPSFPVIWIHLKRYGRHCALQAACNNTEAARWIFMSGASVYIPKCDWSTVYSGSRSSSVVVVNGYV